jgi:hypothetical protein
LSWTTATSTTLEKYDNLLKKKPVYFILLPTHISKLIATCQGCRLLYLPPYSPDFNPIEEAFSSMKAFLRRNREDTSLMSVVHALARITPAMAFGWFTDSGYVM